MRRAAAGTPGARNRGWGLNSILTMPGPSALCPLLLDPSEPLYPPSLETRQGGSQPSSGVGHRRRRGLFLQ